MSSCFEEAERCFEIIDLPFECRQPYPRLECRASGDQMLLPRGLLREITINAPAHSIGHGEHRLAAMTGYVGWPVAAQADAP